MAVASFIATFHRVTRSTAEDTLIFRFTRLERRCSRERRGAFKKERERERERERDVAVEEELTDDRRRDNTSPLRKATIVPACIVSPCCSRCFDPHTIPLRKRYADTTQLGCVATTLTLLFLLFTPLTNHFGLTLWSNYITKRNIPRLGEAIIYSASVNAIIDWLAVSLGCKLCFSITLLQISELSAVGWVLRLKRNELYNNY